MACHVSIERGDFRLKVTLSLSDSVRWLGIVGPSGAGKSTLMRSLAGLEQSAQITGFTDWAASTDGKSVKTVLVSSQTPLFPALSVSGNLALVARSNQVNSAELRQIIQDFECHSLLNKTVKALSGGEAQRVAIARALLARPSVLLLDESASAMDTQLRARVLSALQQHTQHSCKVIWVSHDWQDIARYCDEVAVIQHGQQVLQDAPASALSRAGANQSVNGLTGSILQGPVVEKEADFLVFSIGKHKVVTRAMENPGDRATLLVDARHVLISKVPLAPAQVGYVNRLQVLVSGIATDQHTGLQKLTLQCEDQVLYSLLEAPAARQLSIAPGEAVYAYFGAGSLPASQSS